MRRVRQKFRKSQPPVVAAVAHEPATEIALIQALIPIGLRAVEEALQQEVTALAGARYAHDPAGSAVVRWGTQRGSIYLADQKLPITVPRVRHHVEGREVPLETYHTLQTPRAQDTGLFRRVLAGLSCREYEAAAEAVPAAFGLKRSSVSRRFIRTSADALRRLQERSLADDRWLVLVLDGKTFADDQLVLALGVTITGEKRLLGLVQTATENTTVCVQFLRELVARGFAAPEGLLAILDGAKGLHSAVRTVFGDTAQIQRCQWHKRENVVRHLPPREQATWRRKLQAAYEQSTYPAAKRALDRIHRDLLLRNISAARSLEEGLDETLTLHRLGVFTQLGLSFKTTNLIESVMARVDARLRRVTRWRTSDQKQRWCAAALLALEGKFRRIKGYHHLPLLQQALRTTIKAHPRAVAA